MSLQWQRPGLSRHSLLVKVFAALLMVSVVLVIVLTSSMFYWFRGKTVDNLNQNNQVILLNTGAVFSNYMDNIQNLTLQLFQNVYVRKLMLQDSLNLDENNMNLINQVQNILSLNSYINSVYILNSRGPILKMSKLHAEPEAEKQLFETVSRNTVPAGPLFWTEKNQYDSNRPIRTMTVFYHEGAATDSYFSGAVVLNIDMDAFLANIFSNRIDSKQQLFIMDKSGTVILHSGDMGYFEQNLSAEPHIRRILSSERKYDTFNMKLGGKNHVFSYTPMDDGKFYMVSQMENIHSIGDLVKATNAILVINFLILLFAVLISAFLAYRLSSPVERRIKLLEKEKQSHAIVNAFSSGAEEEKTMLAGLLLKAGAIPGASDHYFIAVVRVEGYRSLSQARGEASMSSFIHSLMAVIHDSVATGAGCHSYYAGLGQIIMVITPKEKGEAPGADDLTPLLHQARDAALQLLDTPVTIGLSAVSQEIRDVYERYDEAGKYTQYRIFFGQGAVVTPHGVALLNQGDIGEHHGEALLQAVKQADAEGFSHALEELLDICRTSVYENSVRFLSAAAASINGLASGFISEESDPPGTSYLDIYNTITGFQDEEELKRYFTGLYARTSSIINDVNGKKVQNIMIDVVEYINLHYYEPELSSNLLAGRLSISTPYFSKIFNDFAGCSVPDYVNRIRLEKARELLLADMGADIKEIARQVGFGSSTYFATAFKKKYGVTPSKFRLNHTVG